MPSRAACHLPVPGDMREVDRGVYFGTFSERFLECALK